MSPIDRPFSVYQVQHKMVGSCSGSFTEVKTTKGCFVLQGVSGHILHASLVSATEMLVSLRPTSSYLYIAKLCFPFRNLLTFVLNSLSNLCSRTSVSLLAKNVKNWTSFRDHSVAVYRGSGSNLRPIWLRRDRIPPLRENSLRYRKVEEGNFALGDRRPWITEYILTTSKEYRWYSTYAAIDHLHLEKRCAMPIFMFRNRYYTVNDNLNFWRRSLFSSF